MSGSFIKHSSGTQLAVEMPEYRDLHVGAVCGLGDYYTQRTLVEHSGGVRELLRLLQSKFLLSLGQISFTLPVSG